MKPVFIVAQYKCGTSWLLSSLAAHPDVIGLREIDIVRAVYRKGRRAIEAAPRDHRLRGFFGTSAWCREDPLDALQRGDHQDPGPPKLGRPQGFADLAPQMALDLYRAVRDLDDPHQTMDAFVTATSNASEGQTTLVLKAADQIAMFDQLQAWRPESPKVAITRDGRDAAISALHYRRLMAEQGAPWYKDAPWYKGGLQFLDLLQNWAKRAAMLAARSRDGELMLVRYEDLTTDFSGTFGRLLKSLGLDSGAELVQKINDRTSFKARTGRDRGTEGSGVIRKGAVGEWRETLSEKERADAWRLAGRELTALGYAVAGPAVDLPDGLLVPPPM